MSNLGPRARQHHGLDETEDLLIAALTVATEALKRGDKALALHNLEAAARMLRAHLEGKNQ